MSEESHDATETGFEQEDRLGKYSPGDTGREAPEAGYSHSSEYCQEGQETSEVTADIAELLLLERRRQGVTQQAVALYLGKTRAAICRKEQKPSADLWKLGDLKAYAQALGLELVVSLRGC